MTLTKIRLKNVQGRTADYDLSPLTMIVGPNESGKTTIVNAITLALRGNVPHLGKTNPDTFKLASGDVMAVLVEIDGAPAVRREWRRMTNGSVKASETYTTSVKLDTLPILNPTAYFDLSPAKRTDYLFAMTAANGDFAEIHAVCDAIEKNDADFSGTDEEALNAMRQLIDERCRGTTPNQAVIDIVNALADEFTDWNRRQKEGNAANAKISELMQRMPKRISDYDALLDELNECREQQKTLAKSIGAVPIVLPDDVHHPQPFRDKYNEWKQKMRDYSEKIASSRDMLRDVDSQDCCPHCLSSQKGWKTKLTASLKEEIARLENAQIHISKLSDAELDLADSERAYDVAVKRAEDDQRKTRATLEAELRTQEANAVDLDRQIKEIERWKSEESMLQKARKDATKAESFLKIVKACQARMAELRTKWVDAVFTDFVARANRFGGDLLRAPLQFADGEIGMLVDNRFVTSSTFCGAERGVTLATVAVALANQSPLRILILDEMGTMTGHVQSQLVRRFRECVEAGELDQVICVIPRDKPFALDGWNVIWTGGEQ